MTEINTTVIEVPKPFKLACELFGFTVSDFLQLFVDHYSFIENFFHDNSAYDLVTKSYPFVMDLKKDDEPQIASNFSNIELNELQKLLKNITKIALNRNYTNNQRRNKGKVLASKMYDILSKNLEIKNVIYLDEDTKISLNKDILINSMLTNRSVIEFFNKVMLKISLPDHLARMHLDQGTYNPALGFYMRVYDGYGDIIDMQYRDSPWFQELLMEIQELNKRYFFYRNLQVRIATYEEWLNNYLDNNNYLWKI